MDSIRAVHNRRVADAEARARTKMAHAKTQAEKLRIRTQLDKERAAAYRELSEAQNAARQASASLRKARIEAGDLTAGEKFMRGLKSSGRELQKGMASLQKPAKPTRKAASRKRSTASDLQKFLWG